MTAKTFAGLEQVLAKELKGIGASDVEPQNRAVLFSGDTRIMYKANFGLRTALRILKPVLKAKIRVQEDLYKVVNEFEWEELIPLGKTIAVDTTLSSSVYTHSQYVSLRVKDAIADRFRKIYSRRPSVNTDNPDIPLNVHLANNELTVSIDTSGTSLHKRGYRVCEVAAPINEVLAAGMLMIAGWNGHGDFHDPMCGSGTLGVEAAMIARGLPPGLFRDKYAFENMVDFDPDLLSEIYDDAEEKKWNGKVFASDISYKSLACAKNNVKKASLIKSFEFAERDFSAYPHVSAPCLTILNPPYGQRMLKNDIAKFYGTMGDSMKKNFKGSDVWVISSNKEAVKSIGLRPTEKIKLFNGPLECFYYKYSIFEGHLKDKVSGKGQRKKK